MAADLDERLSRSFTVREACRSQLASRHGIDNTPDEAQLAAMRHQADAVLQPVRDRFGVTVCSSFLRVLALNRLCGSGDNSQHVKGEATDFEVPGVPNIEVAEWIRDNLEFDQLILEFYVPGDPNSGWIHCSSKADGTNRGEVLTATRGPDGRTQYASGLPEVERAA